jgi:hypothetical protein
VDRFPLGDLAATLSGVVACGEGRVDLRITLRSGERSLELSSADLGGNGMAAIAVAGQLGDRIRQGLSDLSIEA